MRQQQLDVLGEVLDVALSLDEAGQLDLDEVEQGFLCELVDRAARQWREPDAGMWESRDGDRHHTISKVLCWVALDRGLCLGDRLGGHADARRWRRTRDEVREAVLREAWSDRLGALAGTIGGDEPDAALLLLPSYGFLDGDDSRMRATVAAIEERLAHDGLVRRTPELDEDAGFLPAGFWLAACHARAGELDAAEAVFERTAGCANDVGLLSEMAAIPDGEPRGNTPQALSHVGLVRAARAIDRAAQHDGDAARRGRGRPAMSRTVVVTGASAGWGEPPSAYSARAATASRSSPAGGPASRRRRARSSRPAAVRWSSTVSTSPTPVPSSTPPRAPSRSSGPSTCGSTAR